MRSNLFSKDFDAFNENYFNFNAVASNRFVANVIVMNGINHNLVNNNFAEAERKKINSLRRCTNEICIHNALVNV
jgi:aspartate carbamoyltransferase regulatory subunit